jgi:hypothetical protein
VTEGAPLYVVLNARYGLAKTAAAAEAAASV